MSNVIQTKKSFVREWRIHTPSPPPALWNHIMRNTNYVISIPKWHVFAEWISVFLWTAASWGWSRNSIDTCRTLHTDKSHRDWNHCTRQVFSKKKKRKQFHPKRYNLSNFLNWTTCMPGCVAVPVLNVNQSASQPNRACVCERECVRYTQTIMLTPYAAMRVHFVDMVKCGAKELYQKIIYARISIIFVVANTHTHSTLVHNIQNKAKSEQEAERKKSHEFSTDTWTEQIEIAH